MLVDVVRVQCDIRFVSGVSEEVIFNFVPDTKNISLHLADMLKKEYIIIKGKEWAKIFNTSTIVSMELSNFKLLRGLDSDKVTITPLNNLDK